MIMLYLALQLFNQYLARPPLRLFSGLTDSEKSTELYSSRSNTATVLVLLCAAAFPWTGLGSPVYARVHMIRLKNHIQVLHVVLKKSCLHWPLLHLLPKPLQQKRWGTKCSMQKCVLNVVLKPKWSLCFAVQYQWKDSNKKRQHIQLIEKVEG